MPALQALQELDHKDGALQPWTWCHGRWANQPQCCSQDYVLPHSTILSNLRMLLRMPASCLSPLALADPCGGMTVNDWKKLMEDKWTCRTLIHICSLVKPGKNCKLTAGFASRYLWVETPSYSPGVVPTGVQTPLLLHPRWEAAAGNGSRRKREKAGEHLAVSPQLFLQNDSPASCLCLSTCPTQGFAYLHVSWVRQTVSSILQFTPMQMNSCRSAIDSAVTAMAGARAHWYHFIAVSLLASQPPVL